LFKNAGRNARSVMDEQDQAGTVSVLARRRRRTYQTASCDESDETGRPSPF
jgi:hypothetical protein